MSIVSQRSTPAVIPSGRPSASAVLSRLNSEGYEVTYLSAQARVKARRAKRFDKLGDEARLELGQILKDCLEALHVRDLVDVEAGLVDGIDLLAEIDELDRKEDGESHLATMVSIEADTEAINEAGRRIIQSTEPAARRSLGTPAPAVVA